MMGRLKSDQAQLFYEFHLNDAAPEDHLVRKIDAALDLSWPAQTELSLPKPDKSFQSEGFELGRVNRACAS
jgi:hypothetical protein